MEYTKRLIYNHKSLRYESLFSLRSKIQLVVCMTLPAAAIIILAFLFFKVLGKTDALFISLYIVSALLFGSATVICAVVFYKRTKKPHDVLIDDDSIYVRSGGGYFKFNRFEIGTVLLRPGICERGSAKGAGDRNFEVFKNILTFYVGKRKMKIRVINADKLAYVLYNIALFTESAINWGLAYDSAVKDIKRMETVIYEDNKIIKNPV